MRKMVGGGEMVKRSGDGGDGGDGGCGVFNRSRGVNCGPSAPLKTATASMTLHWTGWIETIRREVAELRSWIWLETERNSQRQRMASEQPSIGFDHLVEPMQLDEEQHKEATRAKTTQKTTQHDQEIKKEMKRVSSPFLIVPICDSMRMPLQNGHRPKGTLLKKYRPAFLCFHPYNCIIQSSSFTRFSCCILAANKRVRPPHLPLQSRPFYLSI